MKNEELLGRLMNEGEKNGKFFILHSSFFIIIVFSGQ